MRVAPLGMQGVPAVPWGTVPVRYLHRGTGRMLPWAPTHRAPPWRALPIPWTIRPHNEAEPPETPSLANSYTHKPGLGALAIYAFVAMALAALINGLIVFSDAAEWTESLKKPAYALTGLQIGLLWEFLFACMATAFWLIRRTPPLPDRRAASTAMAVMFLVVLAFPFYAILPQSVLNSFVGTLASAFVAWIVVGVVAVNSKRAAVVLLPLPIWLSFASVIAFHVQRLNPPPGLLG